MAYSSQDDDMQEQSADVPFLQRFPSYSANFQTEIAKSCIIECLEGLITEVKTCSCHLIESTCPLGPDKHKLFGRIGHLLQEGVGNQSQKVLTRQQSVDFIAFTQQNRPRLTDMSTSDSSESRISSLSSTDSIGMYSFDEGSHFVIKKGYLLIINNVWFDEIFYPRSGTNAEGLKMKKLFESFGFHVEIRYNCTTVTIKDLLKQKTDKCLLKEYDCFALLVLSHGAEDCILGSDNKTIKYEEIMGMLKADKFLAMAGKPKLIFAQACRGNTHDSGCLLARGGGRGRVAKDCGTSSQPARVRIPTDSDILIVYATTRSRAAHRTVVHYHGSDAVAESWFLEGLHEVLTKYADNEDLLSMLTRVNCHVSMLGNGEEGKQIPAQFSTLTKKVFLRKRMK